MPFSDVFTVICALLGVVGLMFLTYYATKWLNKRYRGFGMNGGRSGIQIVECAAVAQDKQIIAVRAGKKALLLGVTPNSVTMLCELDEEDMSIIESAANTPQSGSFAESLKNVISSKKGGGNDGGTDI